MSGNIRGCHDGSGTFITEIQDLQHDRKRKNIGKLTLEVADKDNLKINLTSLLTPHDNVNIQA
jgi:hypothetical protein